MIRRLRQRHLRFACFLAVVVPLLLVAALLARSPAPRAPIPAALRSSP